MKHCLSLCLEYHLALFVRFLAPCTGCMILFILVVRAINTKVLHVCFGFAIQSIVIGLKIRAIFSASQK